MNIKTRLSLLAACGTAFGTAVAQDDVTPLSEPMGWNVPLVKPSDGSVPSELDRLSVSPSGAGFKSLVYDSKADNPLVAVAVKLRALDKITATFRDMEIPIGEEAAFGSLTVLPRACDKRPPEEIPETTVFLEVFATQSDVQGARTRASRGDEVLPNVSTIRLPGEDAVADTERAALFRGWMFASSPSLNALQHPVYDVWVIDCKMVDPRT